MNLDPLFAAALAAALIEALAWIGGGLAAILALAAALWTAFALPRRRRRQELADRREADLQNVIVGLGEADREHERECARRWEQQAASNGRLAGAVERLEGAVKTMDETGREGRQRLHEDLRALSERMARQEGR